MIILLEYSNCQFSLSFPPDHHFFFAKLNISHIYVLDFFGGAAEVSVQDYYHATPFP